MGLFRYIKAAFKNRWNLLGLAAGIGFSFALGEPEIGLPLVAAAEAAWLGFVGTHPAFQKHVDMREHAEQKAAMAGSADERMRKILQAVPRGAEKRFRDLKAQCEELRSITQQYQAAHAGGTDDPEFAELRLDGLDRLLWLFLRLLYTEHSLNRFFETTTIDQIDREIHQLEQRLERERTRDQTSQRERIIATIEDNLATCRERKANFEQAHDSYELVKAEQQRLENKIRSLAEMGISKGDPGMLSSQVDSVAGSIAETERTLSGLQFVTGFSEYDEVRPRNRAPTDIGSLECHCGMSSRRTRFISERPCGRIVDGRL